MNDGLIPNRYAKALIKQADEEGTAQEVYGQMKQLALSFSTESALAKVIDNPFLGIADKERVLLAAAGAKQGGTTHRFIKLVVKHNRENFLHPMALAYVDQFRQARNIARVEVVTAVELPDDKLKAIIDVVQRTLSGKTLETSSRVDPELIGGFVVNVDSVVLDASVKNELKKMRLKLLS